MSGYEVVLENMSEAAQAAGDLAEQGSAIDLAAAIDRAPPAIAGARAADKLTGLARQLHEKTAALVEDTRGYSKSMSSAVTYYREHDKRAAEELRVPLGQFGPDGGPR